MFFGQEPANSPLVNKARQAVQEIDLIGDMVNAGVSFEQLSKIRSNRAISTPQEK